MRRRIGLLLLVLAALVAAGYGFWRQQRGEAAAEPGALVLQGNVDIRQVQLAFEVGGRIARMLVDEGDAVAAGQELATLDDGPFRDALAEAEARLAAQAARLGELEAGSRPEEIDRARALLAEKRASLENAQALFQRQEELVRRGAASQQAFDNARAQLRESEAQLGSAVAELRLVEAGPRAEQIAAARAQHDVERAAVRQAERRLADTRLAAPAAGAILTRVREPGAVVNPGETVLALSIASPVWVRAYVAGPDLGRVRPGMAATVSTEAAPGRVYRGHVGFISPRAEFTPKSVETREVRSDLVYRLRIVVDDPDHVLKQGMPATVHLQAEPLS